MAGRHDRATDPSAPGLLATGPVVIRGVSRSIRDAMRPGNGSRHRAGSAEVDPADGHEPARAGHWGDEDAAPADLPLESAIDRAEVEGDDVTEERRLADGRDESPSSEPAATGDGGEADRDVSAGALPPDRDQKDSADVPGGPGGDADGAADDPVGRDAPEDAIDHELRGQIDSEPDESVAPSALEDDSTPLDGTVARGERIVPGAIGSTEEDGGSSPATAIAASGSAPVPSSASEGRRRRLRERLGRETVGVAVLVVLALLCAGLITAVVVKTRNEAASAAREAAAYTPPPLASSTPAPTGPVIAVVSDETALRAAAGTDAAERWPQVLAGRADARVIAFASAGSGYTAAGADGDTFAEAAATVPSSSDVVLFVGGAADASDSTLSIAKAATQAFSAAAKQAPDAEVVAVGPLFVPDGIDADEFAETRTAMQSAARIAGVRWVDPVRSEWIRGVGATSELTPADERTIAGRMVALLKSSGG